MTSYFTALSSLGLQTVHLLLRSLQLPENSIDANFTRPMAALRLLHYSPQVEREGGREGRREGGREGRCL